MGCDIHLMAECRTYGRWERVLPPAGFRDPEALDEPTPEESKPRHVIQWATNWFDGRDYTLFGLLAGVRGDGPPIAEPRGLPEDVSAEGAQLGRGEHLGPDGDVWGGDHTPTWLSLAELEAADWSTITSRGWRASDFLDRTLPGLDAVRRAANVTAADVRIVFNFDN